MADTLLGVVKDMTEAMHKLNIAWYEGDKDLQSLIEQLARRITTIEEQLAGDA